MKNTLAENLLRFGVRNLSESDIKKIEETILTEQKTITYPGIGESTRNDVDLKTKYPQLIKQLSAQLLKQKENDLTPFILGNRFICVPVRHDISRQEGYITTFAIGPYGLPMLTPLTDTAGQYWARSYDTIDNVSIDMGVFTSKYAPKAEQLAAYANQMFTALPSNLITAIYNGNPDKTSFDSGIQNARNEIAKTPSNAKSNLKTIAALLTGSAKAFYNLIPETAAPTTQPAPSRKQ